MTKKRMPMLLGAAIAAQLLSPSAFAEEATTVKPAAARPHIDLAFCIDTTGSMQNEIDNVKAKTKEIVAKLAGGKPAPVIRVGLVAFRDRGDEYVTKVFQFSDDIDKVVKDISSLAAHGGGDGPESVNEALHVSINSLNWDKSAKTLKMLFLIGDASPHKYANDYDWKTEAKEAISKGIQINTLACEGLQQYPETEGLGVFREIAKLADGRFENLSYKQTIVSVDGRPETIISSGGKAYRVKKEGEAWKAGAAALTAAGVAEEARPASPAMTAGAMMASDTAYSRRMSVGGKSLGRARMDMPVPTSAAEFAAAPGGYAVYGDEGGTSRKESNLADLVLDATRDAAEKKLKVDFKAK